MVASWTRSTCYPRARRGLITDLPLIAEDGHQKQAVYPGYPQLALEMGNDLNAIDKNGETLMHGAAYKHVPSVVRLLAQKGARIEVWNQPNKRGWTPLMIAASREA
jgi:ankyrin repeat protein